MRDRTPTRALKNGALRYGVYAEDGSLLRYEYLALEDDPADPGTELSKATLLQDSTEVSLFGSAADRTIDEAFAGIAGQLKLIKSDMAAITLTVQDTTGKPIPEVLVQGILSENGTAVYTNANGVAAGYIGEGAQVIKVSGYADVTDHSETLTVVKGTTITKTWKLATLDFLKITASKSIKFSGNVKSVDCSRLGGGGGGGGGLAVASDESDTGAGGGAGDVVEDFGIAVTANTLYPIVVGAGGKGGKAKSYESYADAAPKPPADDGSDGGSTTAFGKTAEGGKGGKGGQYTGLITGGTSSNGKGADGVRYGQFESSKGKNGEDGKKTIFASLTTTEKSGGGGASGGGGNNYTGGRAIGGSPGGGKGGYSDNYRLYHGESGVDGKGGGGGGGGSACRYNNSENEFYSGASDGGRGGSGCVAIRMHLKSAA